jgi:hypothetical protein
LSVTKSRIGYPAHSSNPASRKCPIPTCKYHKKGFARRHDRNRHALTHYNGIMICEFCPESVREPFHRADILKRHLISRHSVEETPIARETARTRIKHATRVVCSTSRKCSACVVTLYGARDFYEHVDSCITARVPWTIWSSSRKFVFAHGR